MARQFQPGERIGEHLRRMLGARQGRMGAHRLELPLQLATHQLAGDHHILPSGGGEVLMGHPMEHCTLLLAHCMLARANRLSQWRLHGSLLYSKHSSRRPVRYQRRDPSMPMTTYYLGLLYRGPAWTPDETPEAEALQEAHMANIRRMGAEGTLVLAGPLLDDTALRGIYIFKAGSLEDARDLANSDPAVRAGRLHFEMHPWYVPTGVLP
jgi:uncharacterized protein YciI